MHAKYEIRSLSHFGAVTFNHKNFFWAYVTMAIPTFLKISRGHVRTAPANMHVKFEVRIYFCLFRWSFKLARFLLKRNSQLEN